MAFYLRKSVKIGPVRFNLSKSGIGTSVGIKGFRVGVRPNGRSYLHAGGYGIYYRQELGSGGRARTNDVPPPRETEIVHSSHPDAVQYNSASSQELTSKSRKELISTLNDSYKGFRLDYLCGCLFIILSIIFFKNNNIAGITVAIIGVLATAAVAVWESKRRTVTITYEFEDGKGEPFKKLISAFNKLASNSNVWALIDSRNIHGSHESKLNAGASNIISRSDVQIGEGKPPWVNTNIDVPVMKARQQTLYMLPDGILVYDSKGVGFVEYDTVSIYDNTTRFIEERPPRDAKVVDRTWKHPNKKGGPDRRFKDNYEIPICLYGELKIQSDSGLFFLLMTSKHDSPLGFKREFSEVLK
ncbi:DUF4236 domain-containing protein [Candidatus Electronema halotolerans]